MTENPNPGAAPDNRQPDGSRNPAQAPAEAGSSTGGHSHPTEQLDRSGAPGNPTQQLPGAPRPVYPPREPFYGQQASDQQTHSGQPYGQQAHNQHDPHQQPQGAHSALPGGYTGQYNPGQYNSAPNPADAPRRKASFGVGTLVASILAAGLVGGGVATVGSGALVNNSSSAVGSTSSQPGTVIVNNKDDVNAITAAALKATPSVVTISASAGNAGGTGSGIVLDDKGHILTNTHVVTLDGQTANAALEVRTSAGKVLKATLVGTDPLSDLAVIKVDDTSGLTPATLGDSGKLNVGDTAIAIGSPLGLTGTVTDGIVSTLNRTISVASSAAPKNGDSSQGGDQGFQFAPPGGGQGQSTANQGSIAINVIQTDAAINPGNSGGALVNSKGEIIGVNVAIASAGSDSSSSSSSGNIGVGFSIPINHAKRVAQELIDTGKASHGQLGVSVRDKSSGSSSSFSVGADVATVEPNSAAAKAGIKVGDVITKFNDLTVSEPNQLTAAVREQAGGSTAKITVQRNGQEQTLDVTLGTAADQ
ncbi:trypsin-like peptidase domain-containing protein [Pseudarthrobacter sp. H3Y2-7]|jgi:putative serine protease PepD|uniref:S1C family serine protease n=1 Tax=Pseudarthrobacter TaxID=1742993 RepID=UPI0023AFEFE3|nr:MULTISPECIES: trypsin-like peptidase domain-containing protein [unclassified Pseudarthrobacter]MDE8667311.1 trypsin-like peptidase domain-containing protein [Pseudarthrobacter sp. H3Y2-7]